MYAFAKQALSRQEGALDGRVELSPAASLAAGAMAGASTWASCMPQDVVKTRFQTDGKLASYAHACRAVGAAGPGGFLGEARVWRGSGGVKFFAF